MCFNHRGMARVLALLILVSFRASTSNEEYVVNVPEYIADTFERVEIEGFYTSVYKPLGIAPVFVYHPSKRALTLVNQGLIDADAARFPEVAEQYSFLLRVEPAITTVEASLFCFSGVECGVENSKIGVPSGFIQAQNYCSSVNSKCAVEITHEGLVHLLSGGIVNGIIIPNYVAPTLLCDLPSASFQRVAISALNKPVYHYVHRKHLDLLPALGESLRQAQQRALLDKALNAWQEQLRDCGKFIH